MTAADHLARARDRIREAQDDIRAAWALARGSRAELEAELAVLERARDRLWHVRAKSLGLGWRKLINLIREHGAHE